MLLRADERLDAHREFPHAACAQGTGTTDAIATSQRLPADGRAMIVTAADLQDIVRWLTNTLPPARVPNHFLTGMHTNWMLYGTGTAQLTYLAVTDAVAAAVAAAQAQVTHSQINAAYAQVSGRKSERPAVSNYWVQFTKQSVGVVRYKPSPQASTAATATAAMPSTAAAACAAAMSTPSSASTAAAAAADIPFLTAATPIRLAGGAFSTPQAMDFFESFDASRFSLTGLTYAKLVQGARKHDETLSLRPKLRDYAVLNLIRLYAVRRACKFLLYDAIAANCTIRYVLDDLNLEIAARRVRVDGKVPVCTSELREIFRKWDFFRGKVTFYRSFYKVAPPWEAPTANASAIEGWAMYAGQRANKVLSGDLSHVPDAQITLLERVIGHIMAGRYPQAIATYHASMPSMRFNQVFAHANDAVPAWEF